ncbi:transaldolase [Chlamydiifrater volucris]|uniref:transaldolase n=1 Tax=Chlamydiifrater volucris TaxID=2681470 RepID=UPI001BCB1CD0|nr:transaldolase [Chlamydiifrater volucris]
MANQLDQLKEFSTISCDTADSSLIKKFGARDATTNPSLVLRVAQDERYTELLNEAVYWGIKQNGDEVQTLQFIQDKILANIGAEILKEVPGRVSTEIDARLSFNTEGMVQRAKFVMSLYEAMGISKDRILIKLPGTWEGIRAAGFLESEGIKCNITLVFSLMQAIAAAEAKVTLISPFVGRIYDWWIAHYGEADYSINNDPGVVSVTNIYAYYKKFKISTEIMAASFRTKEQVLALAGCDLLTISPKLLEELQQSEDKVERKLSEDMANTLQIDPINLTESVFRYLLNEDIMATDKLSEGIRIFASDTQVLDASITEFIRLISEGVK